MYFRLSINEHLVKMNKTFSGNFEKNVNCILKNFWYKISLRFEKINHGFNLGGLYKLQIYIAEKAF